MFFHTFPPPSQKKKCFILGYPPQIIAPPLFTISRNCTMCQPAINFEFVEEQKKEKSISDLLVMPVPNVVSSLSMKETSLSSMKARMASFDSSLSPKMMKSFSFSHCYCFRFHCCVFHCYHRYQSSKDSFSVESLSLNLFCSRSVPSGFIWRRQCLDKVQAFVINESREMNQRQLTKASLQTAFVNISVPLLEIWKGCLVSWLCLEQTCWRNLFNQVTDKFLKS